MTSLADKIAVVTGAGSGIGRALGVALGNEGATVCVVGRTRDKLEQTAALIGGRAVVCQVDLTNDDEIHKLQSSLQERFGHLDILAHSAGVIAHGPIENGVLDDFDAQYRANLRAPYLLTQRLLPLLKSAPGQVVFINSSAGLAARANASQFSATQAALRAVADSLRAEVNEHGIRVLTVFPGRTATPRQEAMYRKGGNAYKPELLMQPEDIAAMVVCALRLPRTAEVTEITMRPMLKSY